MNHYVYLLRSAAYFYVGIRSCRQPIDSDRYMGSGHAVKCARRAGIQFEKTVLCVCGSREEAAEIEAALVTTEDLDSPGCLNLQTGGKASIVPGERTRSLLSKARRQRIISAETRHRLSESLRRPETRAKLSQLRKGRAPWNRGIPHSIETRNRISEALRKRR